ncbi:hypothetical protein CY35_03G045300 [Sphagnum magellanicum]|nr:hypothetical protein CY35_03G045300 [Sphagnum magellanicum]
MNSFVALQNHPENSLLSFPKHFIHSFIQSVSQSVRLLVPSRRSVLPSLLLLLLPLLLVVLEASMCHCADLDYWYNWTRRYKSIAKQKSPQFSLFLLSLQVVPVVVTLLLVLELLLLSLSLSLALCVCVCVSVCPSLCLFLGYVNHRLFQTDHQARGGLPFSNLFQEVLYILHSPPSTEFSSA